MARPNPGNVSPYANREPLQRRSRSTWRRFGLLILFVGSAGCHPFTAPPELASDAWVSRLPTPPQAQPLATPTDETGANQTNLEAEPKPTRWKHDALEPLLAKSLGWRPGLRGALGDSNPVVVANAAILLARQGDAKMASRLAEAARNTKLAARLRRAAIEALSNLNSPESDRAVDDLLAELGDDQGPRAATYDGDLHAELLLGLDARDDETADQFYRSALKSPSSAARRAALAGLATRTAGEIPIEAVELTSDPDPATRRSALAMLGARKNPRAVERCRQALNDPDFETRLAAVRACGDLAGKGAQAILDLALGSDSELIRVAAIESLARGGFEADWRRLAKDPSFRVRTAVAAAIAAKEKADFREVAERLITDDTASVQLETVRAVENWPLEEAVPVLLAGVESSGFRTRRAAIEQLRRRWPLARELSTDASREALVELAAKLKTSWRAKLGARHDPNEVFVTGESPEKPEASRIVADSATSPLAESSLSIIAETDRTNAADALEVENSSNDPAPANKVPAPSNERMLTALAELESPSATRSVKRKAANDLRISAEQAPLATTTIKRLADVATRETDPLVLRSLLVATANDVSPDSARMAALLSSHEAPEIRLLSIKRLAQSDPTEHLDILASALSDSFAAVAKEAARGLASSGASEAIPALSRMLSTRDPELELEVAKALARLQAATGREALERLARDAVADTRRRAALAMGDLEDITFASTLVSMLDQGEGVGQAALGSLAKVAANEVSLRDGAPPSAAGAPGEGPSSEKKTLGHDERVAAWKRWWQERSGPGWREREGDAASE